MNIRVRVDQLAGPARRRLDGGRRAPIALENFLGLAQADGYRPRPRRHETGGRAALPLDDEHGRDAHDGEVAVAAAELLEREPGAFRHGGDAHLDEHLVRTEARGQVGLEELGSPECPLTARPPRHHGAAHPSPTLIIGLWKLLCWRLTR